ncbi:MAG TPA: SHOCT domain-containing protein [Acholeplasmataceae bacterium]|nr:SHOCT domain-containing protein [Acholeplasmataceae bacterium]
MDQETKNEVWNARVKIVLGRFLIITFEFIFGYLFVTLIILRINFQNDETAAMIFALMGLFLAFVLFALLYILDFRPKWAQIQIFTEHLTLYKQRRKELNIPLETIPVMSFTQDPQGDLRKDIPYQAWKDNNTIMLFPEKPSIEYIKQYLEKQVPYVVISCASLSDIEVKESGRQTWTETAYVNKKMQQIEKSVDTITLHTKDHKQLCFDVRLLTLIETKSISETIFKPSTQPAQQPSQTQDIEMKLKQLKEWVDQGLITQEEYQVQRQKILDRM